MLTFGSIGCGNMGGAILRGVAKLEEWQQVIGFDLYQAATDALNKRCDLVPCASEIKVAQRADLILIVVKPQHVQGWWKRSRRIMMATC
ncbi:NAD(P)-binding domain-containing protein [uncultured Bilophila sp.]|uniref:pyrroline-5-carboxylate reductase family protein n=1 Tax=uncultured Bilophila sp. TaxID=529385 RepID=UPI00280B16F0|nr:NAD(P)-binding domain-containing protein [uncultured Bilophila sp.]